MFRRHIFLKIYARSFSRGLCREKTTAFPYGPVMKHPQLDSDKPKIKIDNETAKLLERLALVELADTDGIKVIEQIVNFCEPLKHVNTEGVEPMVSVLESRNLHLRDDVEEKMNREEILINAAKIEESYFVAPPGNIPLQQDQTHKSQRQKT